MYIHIYVSKSKVGWVAYCWYQSDSEGVYPPFPLALDQGDHFASEVERHTYIRIHTHIHECICVFVCAYIYIYIHMSMYIYMHM